MPDPANPLLSVDPQPPVTRAAVPDFVWPKVFNACCGNAAILFSFDRPVANEDNHSFHDKVWASNFSPSNMSSFPFEDYAMERPNPIVLATDIKMHWVVAPIETSVIFPIRVR